MASGVWLIGARNLAAPAPGFNLTRKKASPASIDFSHESPFQSRRVPEGFSKDMRILVSGRSGQVVTSLIDRQSGDRDQMITLGRPETDLRDAEATYAAAVSAAPDIIVSAAAYTAVDLAESEPEEAYRVNRDGAGALARAAATLDVPIIHLSTDYVFDGLKDSPYIETDPTNPRTVYGASKLAGERAVAEATDRHVILRTSWVYSPYGKNFLKTMLNVAGQRSDINVVSDQHGNPSYAPDLADGILNIATQLLEKQPENAFGVFHMAGSGDTVWSDFAAAIFRESRARSGPYAEVHPILSEEYPTPAARPANSRLNCAKLALTYSIDMPDWNSGVARCLAYILAD
jgi:dTDP-4-dehydrorhamnose reductase